MKEPVTLLVAGAIPFTYGSNNQEAEMMDPDLTPTQGAKELAKAHTVAQLRDMLQTEFDVRPPSKAVKIEIAQQLDDMRHNAKEQAVSVVGEPMMEDMQTAEEGQAQARAWFDRPHAGEKPDTADAQVFQGAMHEATTPQAIGGTLRVLAESMHGVADALDTMGLTAQAAARKLTVAAWSHQVAVVRSMGRTVRGAVVDTVLRAPGPDGMGRVCLVVQHEGHPTRRTLHALADVKFEALAS